MLKESQKVQQSPGNQLRRWFSDEESDLITWQTTSGEISSFQLCIDKTTRERAIVWHKDQPLEHYLVDGGEPSPLLNLSPMMVKIPLTDLPHVIEQFKNRSVEIDPAIQNFVIRILKTQLYSAVSILGTESHGGVYLLKVYLKQHTKLIFGRYQSGSPVHLDRGEYLYIGSALSNKGANTLANRLLRHATRSGKQTPHQIRELLQAVLTEAGLKGKLPTKKTVHWHLDYLLELPDSEITAVLAFRTTKKLEKELVERLTSLSETYPVSPNLGASDHQGYSHLFLILPGENWWEALRKEWESETSSNQYKTS